MGAPTIGFRPTEEDQRIIDTAMQATGDTNTSDVIRRALRLLERETWLTRARADAQRLAEENLGDEEGAW
jgi:antitoxin ParD1/3/4